MWIAKSQKEVCEFFDISNPTLRAWQARGMPGSRGSWDLAAIARWRIERAKDEGRTSPKDDEEKQSSASKKEQLQAELLELKLREQKKDLVEVSVISTWMVRTAGRIRDALNRLQKECGPRALQIMTEALDDLDRELEQGILENTADDGDD